jgi:hypothetical protein
VANLEEDEVAMKLGKPFKGPQYVKVGKTVAIDAGVFKYTYRGEFIPAKVLEREGDQFRVSAGDWWDWVSHRVLRRVSK